MAANKDWHGPRRHERLLVSRTTLPTRQTGASICPRPAIRTRSTTRSIEHDDLGQALVTLPLAVVEGGAEVVAWAASETIIPVAEHLIEAFSSSPEAEAPVLDIPSSPEETSMHVEGVAHEEMP